MNPKDAVLFVCVHNSARSQMAEAFLRRAAGDTFDAYSAGIEPGALNADVVAVMAELGYDLAGARTKSVNDAEIAGRAYRYVVTVCAETEAEACPVVPTEGRREHWAFEDPSAVTGAIDARRHVIRGIRDRIKARVEEWATARRAERSAAV